MAEDNVEVQVSSSSPLLASSRKNDGDDDDSKLTLVNFVLMAFALSFEQGVMIVAVNYASSILTNDLGVASNATVYFAYTFSCLLASSSIVDYATPRLALIGALCALFIYQCLFSVATIGVVRNQETTLMWFSVLTGSAIGGVGASVLWVAQGAYFSRTAVAYAKAQGLELDEATNWLAGIFSAIYIGCTLLLLLSSSLLIEFTEWDDFSIFSLYVLITGVTVVAMYFIEETPKTSEQQEEGFSWKHLASVIRVTFTDPRAIGLAPANAAFGMASGFMSSYVNAETVTKYMGESSVGYLECVQYATLILVTLPVSTIATHYSKTPVMLFGSLAFLSLGILYLAEDDAYYGTWSRAWIPYVLFGLGRVTWENTMKALYSELFPGKESAAGFSNLYFVFGSAATVYYFLVLHFGREPLASIVLIISALSVPGYLYTRSVAKDMGKDL